MSGILMTYSGGGFPTLLLDISNKASPDIPSLLTAAGWKGASQPVKLVNSGNVNTLVIPSSLAGTEIYLLNQATGLIGGVMNSGTALRVQVPIKVENLGKIYGGGGKGGDGGYAWARYSPPTYVDDYASGDAGLGGNGQGFANTSSLTINAAVGGGTGGADSCEGHLAAGEFPGDPFPITYVTGGNGGNGGNWGAAGGSGTGGGYSGGSPSAAGTGNPGGGNLAGYYIDGNANVTWVATGDRLGRSV